MRGFESHPLHHIFKTIDKVDFMYQKQLTRLPGKKIAKIIESDLKPELKAEKLYGIYSRLNEEKKDQLEYEFDVLYMESTFLTLDGSLVEVKPTPTNN